MEKLMLTISETAEVLGIGRSKMFELLGSGRLPVVRIGKAVRIPRRELEQWIHRQAEESLTAGVDSESDRPSVWTVR